PYGHGKIENVSALIETGLLFLTGAWIIKEAVERLFSQPRPIETPWYAVAVIVISIFIDIGRSRALMKVARATGSQALEADALHFTSDILTSAVVLAGLGFVALGWEKGDALAAIAVAICVAVAGYRLGKRTIDVLMDKAPDGIAEHVETIALAIPGIIRVERVRARPAGAIIFVELSLKVSRTLPLERVEALRAEVAERVRKALPQVEPLVVAEPLALDDETIAERVRVAAACRNLSVHDIGVHAIGATRLVSFDVEVDEALTIKAAHDITTELERAVSAELGGGVVVDTHIDPRRSVVSEATDLDSEVYARLSSTIRGLAEGQEMVHGVHRIQAQRGGEGLYISFHCAFADAAPVRKVHDVTVRL
ncbi:MAG: cation-efflux pump, partial [Rhodospirillales bacterium]|nr:cation-efflux pump [Rhodospirillales bacterium]